MSKWLVKWFSICLFFPFDLFVNFFPLETDVAECSNRSSHSLKLLCSKYSKEEGDRQTNLNFFSLVNQRNLLFTISIKRVGNFKIISTFSMTVFSLQKFCFVWENIFHNEKTANKKVEPILNFPTLLIQIVKSKMRLHTNVF